MCDTRTSPSMRACSDSTSVPGLSSAANTLPRTWPSIRKPPVKVILPSTVVPAPIRLSIRFCGLLLLLFPNMMLLPLSHDGRLNQFRIRAAIFEYPDLYTFHLRPGRNAKHSFDTLVKPKVQPIGLHILRTLRRQSYHQISVILMHVDHQLQAALKITGTPTGLHYQQLIMIFAWQRVGF